jgi:hypothetical protein
LAEPRARFPGSISPAPRLDSGAFGKVPGITGGGATPGVAGGRGENA